jgi:hypothetical protein
MWTFLSCLSYCGGREKIKRPVRGSRRGRGLRARPGGQLGPRDPLSPAGYGLPLLPSGPGGVHRPASQGARPSSPPFPSRFRHPTSRGTHGLHVKRVFGFRGPLTPHPARAWRRGRDLNPRHPFGVHLLSRQVVSAARPPLLKPKYTQLTRKNRPNPSQRRKPKPPASVGVRTQPARMLQTCRRFTVSTPLLNPTPTTAPTTA